METRILEREAERLRELEETIEQGMTTFIYVGRALLEIRDSKLYKNQYSTFEQYCKERWGWSRIHAYRHIEAAKTADILLPIGNIPETESQVRPLTSLEPQEQIQAWSRAKEIAEKQNKTITANIVQDAVDEIKKPHVTYNTGNNEWYTPEIYIEAAKKVLGTIELDPASSKLANETVKANTYFDEDDNGLNYHWSGKVWMNPPYASDLIGKFTTKITEHFKRGDITEAIILVNNATETNWFCDMIDYAAAIVFHRGRIRFINNNGAPGTPLQGQAFIYFGDRPDAFLNSFREFGWGTIL